VPHTFSMQPRGPFDLAHQRRFFGPWLEYSPDPTALAMTFPVEGWAESAAVVLRQRDQGTIAGVVHGADGDAAKRAWEQALAVLSLDVDGTDFPTVGERDPVIGRLQREHGYLRPSLFHSPYEAACNFVIGQRISIAQARAVRGRMAAESGDTISAGGVEVRAFPQPQTLLGLRTISGVPGEKVTRLHGIAQAAIDGVLDRARLRSLSTEAALAEVSALRGVGPFSAQGIVFRGAGVVDEVTDEPVSKAAVQRLYSLDHLPDHAEVMRRAEVWRPFRMWSLVLLHVWIRGEGGGLGPRRAHGLRGNGRA
jgi:DNA-3-methyladenine glycosylase II